MSPDVVVAAAAVVDDGVPAAPAAGAAATAGVPVDVDAAAAVCGADGVCNGADAEDDAGGTLEAVGVLGAAEFVDEFP